ncbi:hypothetical protein [Hymenobacter sp. UYP22]|uniref:hypothetical protein n=1 Tax=Hymenobacter sp. UYP22 TaxID=3156348 RepID=UPI003392C5BB
MKAHLLLVVGLLSSGRAAAQAAPGPAARLVVYREREFGGNTYTLKLNDKVWGPLPANRYVQLEVPPGRTKLESVKDYFSENQTVWLEVQPGRTYFVKAVEEVDFLTRTLLMVPVREEQARRELLRLKPAGESRPR